MTTVTVHTEVDVDLRDVEEDDLVEELAERGVNPSGRDSLLRAYEAYRGRNLDALERALADLFDAQLGRLVGDAPWRGA